jgi:hypothetical protein
MHAQNLWMDRGRVRRKAIRRKPVPTTTLPTENLRLIVEDDGIAAAPLRVETVERASIH